MNKLLEKDHPYSHTTVYQSFFCHGFLNCCQIRTIPVFSYAVCSHVRIVFVYSHLYQISFLCSWKFSLFPYTHAYSVIEPSVDVFNIVPRACYSIIVQPFSCIYLDFLKTWFLPWKEWQRHLHPCTCQVMEQSQGYTSDAHFLDQVRKHSENYETHKSIYAGDS